MTSGAITCTLLTWKTHADGKTVCMLISCVYLKPADLDLHNFVIEYRILKYAHDALIWSNTDGSIWTEATVVKIVKHERIPCI